VIASADEKASFAHKFDGPVIGAGACSPFTGWIFVYAIEWRLLQRNA
jgi:hypothetical protein